MEKKYIILLVVVVVLWIGFMVYRHSKNEKDLAVHHADTYNRMVEVAKKSPKAGLAEMGIALKRYYAANHSYPPSLAALYPNYLSSKALLDEISWNYEPGRDNFYLSKSIIRGDREMVASIDKDLRPRMVTGVMVAAKAEEPVGEAVAWEETGMLVAAPLAPPEETEPARLKDTGAQLDEVRRVAMAEPEIVSVEAFKIASRDKTLRVSRVKPETVSIIDSEIASGIASDVTQRFLVWKDSNGTLGFGNVNYPLADRFAITTFGKWYNVKRQLPEKEKSIAFAAEAGKKKRPLDQIAADLSERALVWKDSNGIIGFGDVEYPDADQLAVSTGDRWYNIKKRSVPKEKSPTLRPVASKRIKAPDQIAASFGGQYLVWKDPHGTIGFGNVEYPDADRLSIQTGDGWDTLKRQSLEKKTVVSSGISRVKKKKDFDALVSNLSHRYLVWKDKDGVVGFGDVEYPDNHDMSHIHEHNRWQKVVN
jgi:hypothetical protein